MMKKVLQLVSARHLTAAMTTPRNNLPHAVSKGESDQQGNYKVHECNNRRPLAKVPTKGVQSRLAGNV